MIDEYLLAAVVSTLVGATVERLGEAGRILVGRLRRRAREDPQTAAVLEGARALPHDQALIAARTALARLAAAAPDVADLVVQVGTQLPGPRQLPLAPARWVDRAGELAAVLHAIRDGQRRLVISGLPGVGKSALALRAAAQVCTEMGMAPDGQLYLDLTGPQPLPIEEALGQLLRSLRVPADQVPSTVAEQAALWRTVTTDRRLLMVLDGAHSPEHVRPLLPASNDCVVLVTARTRLPELAVDGAHAIHLAPLAHTDAIDLLRQFLGDARVRQDLAAAEDLVRVCGGLPHAVTLTAARLAAHPRWSIRDLVPIHQDLQSFGGVPSMAFALDMAYRGLSPDAARCFRLLALHPGSEFGSKVAAAALTTARDTAVALLDELEAADLLEQPVPGRWRYPQSAREYALIAATDDPDRRQARERIIRWYLMMALASARLLTPYMRHLTSIARELAPAPMPVSGRADALGWLEQERLNLVAAVTESAQWSPRLAWQLAHVMWPLFHLNRHHRDREWIDQVAVQCARQLGDPQLADALTRQGWGQFDRGDLTGAAATFSEALLLAERLDDATRAGAALDGLGNTRLAQANTNAAHDLFAHQLALAEEQAETRPIAMALHNLGKADAAAGQIQQAAQYLEGALALFADLGDLDHYNEALTAINYARALVDAGHTDKASKLLDDALARMTALASPRGQALAHWILGQIAHRSGRIDQAIDHLTSARDLFDRLGDRETETVTRLLSNIEGKP
ncbi:tetratricopeptide repeat protein [Micromonospora sp. CPCC 206061]|uniref:tetratricopeptide repeat protein n=1 Tax=Micromonospora sp. CPCC 206061 TaxID=3122410 RepID=UPI002FEFECDA